MNTTFALFIFWPHLHYLSSGRFCTIYLLSNGLKVSLSLALFILWHSTSEITNLSLSTIANNFVQLFKDLIPIHNFICSLSIKTKSSSPKSEFWSWLNHQGVLNKPSRDVEPSSGVFNKTIKIFYRQNVKNR